MPKYPDDYVRLMLKVERKLESTPKGLREFQDTCQRLGHVAAFKLHEKTASDVIRRLQMKLVVGPNDFEKFIEILEIIGREDVIRMLPSYQNYKIKDDDIISETFVYSCI